MNARLPRYRSRMREFLVRGRDSRAVTSYDTRIPMMQVSSSVSDLL